MDFSLTENHREVEALAKQLLSELASEERHRELDKLDDRFDAKAWKVLGESGLLAVWLDEADGGAGMSLIEWASIAEAVGRRAAAIPFVSASIAAMAIARFGSSAQKAAHLPGFAAGTHLLAYGNAGLRQVAPGFPVGCVVKTAAGDQLTGYWTGIAGGMQAHALLLSALDEAGEILLEVAVAVRASEEPGLAQRRHRHGAVGAALHRARGRLRRLLEQLARDQRGAGHRRQDVAALRRVLGAQVDLALQSIVHERLVHDGGIGAAVAGSFHGGVGRGVMLGAYFGRIDAPAGGPRRPVTRARRARAPGSRGCRAPR
jgi:hypothetical protein